MHSPRRSCWRRGELIDRIEALEEVLAGRKEKQGGKRRRIDHYSSMVMAQDDQAERRLDGLTQELTARQRAILVMQSWLRGEKFDTNLRDRIPEEQKAEYDRIVGAVEKSNGDLGGSSSSSGSCLRPRSDSPGCRASPPHSNAVGSWRRLSGRRASAFGKVPRYASRGGAKGSSCPRCPWWSWAGHSPSPSSGLTSGRTSLASGGLATRWSLASPWRNRAGTPISGAAVE